MVLLHGDDPGVETVAAKWAEARGVYQLVCKPDRKAHGKTAPLCRNDELLNLLPKDAIAFLRGVNARTLSFAAVSAAAAHFRLEYSMMMGNLNPSRVLPMLVRPPQARLNHGPDPWRSPAQLRQHRCCQATGEGARTGAPDRAP